MFRTAVLGALIACIPAVVAAAWPQPAPESTAAWNSPEYDALWISLSGAEDELATRIAKFEKLLAKTDKVEGGLGACA